jgi:hypothetical protein
VTGPRLWDGAGALSISEQILESANAGLPELVDEIASYLLGLDTAIR